MRVFILCLAISTILSPLFSIELYLCDDLSFTFPSLTNQHIRQPFLVSHFIQDPTISQLLDTIYTTLSSCEPHAISTWKTFKPINRYTNKTVGTIDELPGFVLKSFPLQQESSNRHNIFRPFIAQRMREFIRQQNYTKIVVPHKYLYLPPQASRYTSKQFLVIAEKIPGLPDLNTNKINLERLRLVECQQALDELFNVIVYGCYFDANHANIFAVFTHDGRFSNFALIDTEPICLDPFTAFGKEAFYQAALHGLRLFAGSLKSDIRSYWERKIAQLKQHIPLEYR